MQVVIMWWDLTGQRPTIFWRLSCLWSYVLPIITMIMTNMIIICFTNMIMMIIIICFDNDNVDYDHMLYQWLSWLWSYVIPMIVMIMIICFTNGNNDYDKYGRPKHDVVNEAWPETGRPYYHSYYRYYHSYYHYHSFFNWSWLIGPRSIRKSNISHQVWSHEGFFYTW